MLLFPTQLPGPAHQSIPVGYNTGTFKSDDNHLGRKENILVPSQRNLNFTGRDTIIADISQIHTEAGSIRALVGVEGAGKSQLAIECAYRINKQSPKTWVLWFDASSDAHLEQSYRKIAEEAGIFGRQGLQKNIFELVHHWLEDEKRKWVLIFDDVGNAQILRNAIQEQLGPDSAQLSGKLRDCLPPLTNGSILITTRSSEAASELVEARFRTQIGPMSEEDAVQLLKKKLTPPRDSHNALALVTALEYMPRAIDQAAAYISYRSPTYSIEEYLRIMHPKDRVDAPSTSLDGNGPPPVRENRTLTKLTSDISLDHFQEDRPSVANLLFFMSCSAGQEIAKTLLPDQKAPEEVNQDKQRRSGGESSENEVSGESISGMGVEVDKQIQTLQNFSFISVGADEKTFAMHRVVQDATQKRLRDDGQLENWKHHYLRRLNAIFPEGEDKNLARCEALFPHVRLEAMQPPQTRKCRTEWASLLHKAAWYAWRRGNAADAASMATKAMQTRMELLGQEHQDTLNSMSIVGSIYTLQGRFKEAEDLFVQVIKTDQRLLGSEQPVTVMCLANLAAICENQGRWKEAEEMGVQATKGLQRVLGIEHPHTLTSMANLASVHRSRGQLKKAEELGIQVTKSFEKVLGRDHPNTLTSTAILASIYKDQGRWKKAGESALRVVDGRKEVLGLEHPQTLLSMIDLASTHRNQGRWKDAEELYDTVTETRERLLGREHIDTLSSMAHLASTHWNQGRRMEGEELQAQIVMIGKQALSLANMANLASTFWDLGQWREAEELHKQMVKISKKELGRNHSDTLTSMANLAITFWNQGRWKAAEELEVRVTETRKKKLGQDHPSTLTSMGNLASTYRKQSRWKEAEELEMQVMRTRQEVLGKEHISTLISMGNLASTYRSQDRLQEAEQLQIQVMEIQKRVLGSEHPDTLISMKNLASIYQSQDQWKEAGKRGSQMMEASMIIFGPESPSTLRRMYDLALSFNYQHRTAEAIELMQGCVQLQTRILGADHPDTSASSEVLHKWEKSVLSFEDSEPSDGNDSILSASESHSSTLEPGIKSEGVNLLLVKEFVSLVYDDATLISLISSATSSGDLGFGRTHDKFQRLLKQYATILKAEGLTDDHRVITEFVNTYSVDITRELFSTLSLSKHDAKLRLTAHSRSENGIGDRQKIAEDELSQFTDIGEQDELDKIDEEDNHHTMGRIREDGDEDSLGEEAEDKYLHRDSLAHLHQMRLFLLGGAAYQTLRRQLYEFTKPTLGFRLRQLVSLWSKPDHKYSGYVTKYKLPNLIAELQFVRPQEIRFAGHERPYHTLRNLVNSFQSMVEDCTEEAWDWWPLPPPLRTLKEKEVRVRWECTCGEERWAEVPSPFARRLKAIIRTIPQSSNRASSYLPPFPFEQASSEAEAHESSGIGQGTQQQPGIPLDNIPQSLELGAQVQSTDANTSELRILFVVRKGHDYKLAQIPTKGLTSHAFFNDMRSKYFELRGFLRCCFSLWRYSHCDFFMFEKFDEGEVTPVKMNDLPAVTNTDYVFTPRETTPPIAPHEFFHRFYACQMLRRLMHRFQRRKSSGVPSHQVLEYLPKKSTKLDERGDGREFFWGLYVREYHCAIWVVAYNAVGFLPCVIYFFVWISQEEPKTDLVGLSISFSITMGMLSMFWSLFLSSRSDNKV